jgi:nucleoside-diphosphate-sugar epimerase
MVTINQLANMIAIISGKKIKNNHIPGPQGVRGRNSDNRLYENILGWRVNEKLEVGLRKTYPWIAKQVECFGR